MSYASLGILRPRFISSIRIFSAVRLYKNVRLTLRQTILSNDGESDLNVGSRFIRVCKSVYQRLLIAPTRVNMDAPNSLASSSSSHII